MKDQFQASCDCLQSVKPVAMLTQQPDVIMSKSMPQVEWVWTNAVADDDADARVAEAVSVDDEGDDSRVTPIWLANQQVTDHRNQTDLDPHQNMSTLNLK